MPLAEIQSVCQRCRSTVALDLLSRDHRCPPCDLAYYQSRDRLNTGAWFAAGFVVPWLVFAWIAVTADLPSRAGGVRAITTGFPILDVGIMTAVLAVFGGKLVLAVRRWFHRREFDRVLVGPFSSGRRAAP